MTTTEKISQLSISALSTDKGNGESNQLPTKQTTMNKTPMQTDMFPGTKIYGKYHLVTYCEDNGEDDKDYVNSLGMAEKIAKQYLKGDNLTLPYEKV